MALKLSNFINENSAIHFKEKEIEDGIRILFYVGETNVGKVEATIKGSVAEVTYLKLNEFYRGYGYGAVLMKRLCMSLIQKHGINEINFNIKATTKVETRMFRTMLISIGFSINKYGTNEANFTLKTKTDE